MLRVVAQRRQLSDGLIASDSSGSVYAGQRAPTDADGNDSTGETVVICDRPQRYPSPTSI
jgi:hypothetical protein